MSAACRIIRALALVATASTAMAQTWQTAAKLSKTGQTTAKITKSADVATGARALQLLTDDLATEAWLWDDAVEADPARSACAEEWVDKTSWSWVCRLREGPRFESRRVGALLRGVRVVLAPERRVAIKHDTGERVTRRRVLKPIAGWISQKCIGSLRFASPIATTAQLRATEARGRARATNDDEYDPRGRPIVYGGASKLDLVPEADLDATAGVPLDALEGVPDDASSTSHEYDATSADATPITDRYDAATPVTDRCILGAFLNETPATPTTGYRSHRAEKDGVVVTYRVPPLDARQASATKLDKLCRKARILRQATVGEYGDALAARLAAAGARAAEARRAGRPVVTPERLREMMRIVNAQRSAAALQRSPRKSPRKSPHKFRGATIYLPPKMRVVVPVPTLPGF